MVSRKSLLFLFSLFAFFFFIQGESHAQIYDPVDYADQTRSTAYGEDTIFIFYSDTKNKVLRVEHSTNDTATYTWSVFNKTTETYDSLFTHTGLTYTGILLDSLYENGQLDEAMEALQVKTVSDNGQSELYRCWVVLDTFPDFGEIRVESNVCRKLWFEIDKFELPEYTYYKLSDSSYISYRLTNNRNVTWESSENVDIYNSNVLIDFGDKLIGKIGSVSGTFGSSEYIGPYEASDYYLTVENSFGNSQSDTIFDVAAKTVKAEFTVKKVDDEGNQEAYNESDINEALFQIALENESKNETYYHWIGYNDSLNILQGKERILWENRQETPSIDSIPEYKPGEYPVKLIVSNDFECVDSMTFYHVSIDSSLIDSALIPNVFTPNGDGANDVFVLPKKSNLTGNGSRGFISMKTIDVTIMNRNGELVYNYQGRPEDWEGWEGKVKNSNRDASEGIYLYVITGIGYDGTRHQSKNYTGFLYLFR